MFSHHQAEMSDILAGQSDLQMINPTIRAITRLDVHTADSVEKHNNIGYKIVHGRTCQRWIDSEKHWVITLDVLRRLLRENVLLICQRKRDWPMYATVKEDHDLRYAMMKLGRLHSLGKRIFEFTFMTTPT